MKITQLLLFPYILLLRVFRNTFLRFLGIILLPKNLRKGFSKDFIIFLKKSSKYNSIYLRRDMPYVNFGGKENPEEQISHFPVIFLHGNSDKAIGIIGKYQSGWNNSIKYFLEKGYKLSELYGFTWGDASVAKAVFQTHSKINLIAVRSFIEIVLEYTQAKKVNIIAHSMGVTLARRAILGGKCFDPEYGYYELGIPLTNFIHTFVGIAGGNLGLESCKKWSKFFPTCNKFTGFYPGEYDSATGKITNLSQVLKEMLLPEKFEGERVFSIWSPYDEVVKNEGLVYNRLTCQIPNQDGEIVFYSSKMSHFNLKVKTFKEQLELISDKQI